MSGKKRGSQPTTGGTEKQHQRTISKRKQKQKNRQRFELLRRIKRAKKNGNTVLVEKLQAQL